MNRPLHRRMLAIALAAVAYDAVAWPAFAAAEIPAIASRQRAEKRAFTDSQIIDGFLKTAFGAEHHLAGRVDRIRKYPLFRKLEGEGKTSASLCFFNIGTCSLEIYLNGQWVAPGTVSAICK